MLEVLACILIADFITGLGHWIEDTYGLPDWPLIGKAIIEPNLLHHSDPVHFTMSSILYRNYQVFAIAAAFIALAWCVGLLCWQVALTVALVAMGNEVHAWAHKRPRSRIVRLLLDTKILLSPEQHARHHRKPYDVCFCTLTNWLNPVLDAVKFWRGLEWLIGCAGIGVKRMSVERGGL